MGRGQSGGRGRGFELQGRIVERVGSFQGVGKDGAAKGLLFPASIVISRGDIYVTNLALAANPPPRVATSPRKT